MPRQYLALFLLFLITGNVSTASSEPIDKARRLVEVSQGKFMIEQMFNAIVPPIMNLALRDKPDLSDEKKATVIDVTKQEFDAAIPEFVEATAQTYARHFSEKELQDVIDFYESPTGKKFQDLVPTILQESMAEGRVLGENVQRRAVERLKAEGVL